MNFEEGKPPEGYNVEVRALAAVSDTPGDDPSSHSISCIEHFTDFFHHVEYSVSSASYRVLYVKVIDRVL